MVIFVTPLYASLVVWVVAVRVAGITILVYVVKVVVSLEDTVVLNDPMPPFGNIRFQYSSSDLRVIVFGDELTDVVEQSHKHRFIIGIVFMACVMVARRGLYGELRARLADGTINLPVSSVHALDDITDAVRASGEAGRVGKVLLRP